MFSWFDARAAKAFGAELAALIVERTQRDAGRNARKASQSAERVAQEVANRLAAFRKQQALNIFKKAQLGNEFKWGLQQAGLEKDKVDSWTTFVLSRL